MPVAAPPPARTALVTGGSRGIGEQLALGLAAAGLDVAVLGRDRAALGAVVGGIEALGRKAVAVTADVTDRDAVQRAADEVAGLLGGIDLLVNNAGLIEADEVPVWEADPDTWRRVIEVDLLGPFHAVRAVVPGMIARGGGRVVDLNSGAGTRDAPEYSAYHAAKTGLFRLGGALHQAGAGRGLRAFELAPGVVPTEMTRAMPVHAGRTEWTPVEAVVELLVQIATGRLDAWSGCFLRAGLDTPQSLATAAGELAVDGFVPTPVRRLGVHRYGPDDPLPA